MHIQSSPPPGPFWKGSCLLSISVWINIIYIGVRKDKHSCLFVSFFFPPTFANIVSLFLLCSAKMVVESGLKLDHSLSSTLKKSRQFVALQITFLPSTTRPCPPWRSLDTWTETLKVRPQAGRSLWTLSVRKKRNSPRSGRTKIPCRSSAWWGLWGPTAWRTLSGERWNGSLTFALWSVKDFTDPCCLVKGYRLNSSTFGLSSEHLCSLLK